MKKKGHDMRELISFGLHLLTTALIAGSVSFVMMKWHIANTKKLYDKYFDIESSLIEEFAKSIIENIKK